MVLCTGYRLLTQIMKKVLVLVLIIVQSAALSHAQQTNPDTTINIAEVTVKSTLPRTRMKGDAQHTTISGTILEKAGSANDVLNKLPGLKAEDDVVEVIGRGNAEVYINGRKVLDMKELQRITSEQIQSVDVIQNPGARYAASTRAVVRIQLKKKQGEGWSFMDYLNTSYQYNGTIQNTLDANYRQGGLDITTTLNAVSYGFGLEGHENDISYFEGNNHYLEKMTDDQKTRWNGFAPQLQVNYQFDDEHSMGAYYKFTRHPSTRNHAEMTNHTFFNDELLEKSVSDIITEESFSRHIFNTYYNGKMGKLGIDFNLDGYFDNTKEPNSTHEITTDKVGKETHHDVSNFTKSRNNFWATKLILTYPVWQGNLSFGGEYSNTDRKDAYSFKSEEFLPVTATDSKIRENMASGFVEYGKRFGMFYAQLGARYEYLGNDYYNFGVKQDDVCRRYSDWFPTATFSLPVYIKCTPIQFSLSYRRDISRPDYSFLSSSTVYVNRYTYQSGNPHLKPSYTHSIVFNTAWKELNFMVNYGHQKDMFTMVTEPYPESPDPLVSLIHPVNSAKDFDQCLVMLSYRPTIGKWHPTWVGAMMIQNYQTLNSQKTMMTMNHPFGTLRWDNDIEFPHDFRLNVMAELRTQGDYNNIRVNKNNFQTRIGVQKDFNLRDAGKLTLEARCTDPFAITKTDTRIYGIREITSTIKAKQLFEFSAKWRLNEAGSKYRGTGAGEKQKSRMGGQKQ